LYIQVIWPKLFSVVKSSGPGGMIFALAALIVVVLLSPLFIVCHPSFTPACLLGQLKEFQTLIAGVCRLWRPSCSGDLQWPTGSSEGGAS
jgi:hypothetical protein